MRGMQWHLYLNQGQDGKTWPKDSLLDYPV